MEHFQVQTVVKIGEKNRIAAKPRSHMWSTILKENRPKLTFREGLQPWDLARCSGCIEIFRSMLELLNLDQKHSSNQNHIGEPLPACQEVLRATASLGNRNLQNIAWISMTP